MDKKEEALREMYQHCCICQDLAESIGDWDLFSTFEKLRRELDCKMFG